MKIAYIVPGTGGSFYCGNCLRDTSFIKAIEQSGHETMVIPLYLPLNIYEEKSDTNIPIFYGAVNLYLKEQSPVFKKMPVWVTRFLNSNSILHFAARRAGSTSPSGLESMTISMLKGENGNQADDLDILIKWFKTHGKPDVVHLSNALLLGLAPALKKELGVPVICTLQDEDEWLDEMKEPYQNQAWQLILENASCVDCFIPVSHYYKKKILDKISIPENKIQVVYNGVDSTFARQCEPNLGRPVIGYLSKMSEAFGLEILLDAFILLSNDSALKNVELKITGGYSADANQFKKKIYRKITNAGLQDRVEFIAGFDVQARKKFFEAITVFSVPAVRHEAFGMHLVEAMASGIPVVQPDQGAYSEIIGLTGAGVLYSPNTPEQLAGALKKVLTDKNLYYSLRKNCFTGVDNYFSEKKQTGEILKIYKSLTGVSAQNPMRK